MLELNGQAAHTRKVLDQLAASWQVNAPRPNAEPIPTSGPLAKPVSLVWYGPLGKGVRSIAELVGYGFQVEGKAPANPVLVSVNAYNQPAYAILQDMGWQAGSHASVVVRPDKHLIAVIYIGESSR